MTGRVITWVDRRKNHFVGLAISINVPTREAFDPANESFLGTCCKASHQSRMHVGAGMLAHMRMRIYMNVMNAKKVHT